ncbi:unnamed protein product [Rhodiola kirilowii]
MPRFLCTINLDDEKANYTIGQMLSHLQLSIDRTEFDKVEKLLKRREEKLKEEAWKKMKAEVEKVKSAAEVREREFLTEMEQMSKGLNEVEAKYEELVKWKVVLEERFDEVDKEKGDLVEEVRMLREMNEDLKKREEAGKVRLSELEKSNSKQHVIVEESFEKLEKDKLRLGHEVRLLRQELKKREDAERFKVLEMENLRLSFDRLKKEENEAVMKDNVKLKKEVRAWREINEELKNREVAEKVRVLELELKVEIEERLRVRAEEDFEALEKSFKELELKNSLLEKCSNMLMNGGTGRVVPTISSMEVASCSRRSYVGTANGNVIDLTDEADDVLPGIIQTGNLMEDPIRLNPSVTLNESGSHTHTTKDKIESRQPIAKPAGFKRKRVRSVNKENPQESEPSNDKHTCQKLPVHESERTPAPASCVFSIRPSPSKKSKRNKFDGTPGRELGQGKRVDPAGSKEARKSERIRVSSGQYPSHTYELRMRGADNCNSIGRESMSVRTDISVENDEL